MNQSRFSSAPIMNYQNTYRLEPHSPYNRDKCDAVLKEVIDAAMEEYQYNSKLANTFCSNLAEEIRKRIKELAFDRYKFICTVTVGERYLQGLQSIVKFLWDADRDGFTSYAYDTPQFFCLASVYAVYLD